MLFESQFRNLIRQLLIEGKVDMLQARYPNIDVDEATKLDPTPQLKYLQWIVVQLNNDKNESHSDEEIKHLISRFHSIQQRLSVDKRDINQYKTIDELKLVLSNISNISNTRQRKDSKVQGRKLIYENEDYKVYEISTHDACVLLGSSTKWCITQKNDEDWLDYETTSKFLFAISKQPEKYKEYNFEKIAFELTFEKNRLNPFELQSQLVIWDSINTEYSTAEFERGLNNPNFDQLYDVYNFVKNLHQNSQPSLLNKIIAFERPDPRDIIQVLKTQKISAKAITRLLFKGIDPKLIFSNLTYDEGVYYELAKMFQANQLIKINHEEFRRKGHDEMIFIGHNSEFAEDGVFFYKDETTLHRLDGPAVKTVQGRIEWWIDGQELSKSEFDELSNN